MNEKIDDTATGRSLEDENKIVRARLERDYGQVWDTTQLQQDYTVKAFLAPYVLVIRNSDDKEGTLEFMHRPRFYYNFQEANNARK